MKPDVQHYPFMGTTFYCTWQVLCGTPKKGGKTVDVICNDGWLTDRSFDCIYQSGLHE